MSVVQTQQVIKVGRKVIDEHFSETLNYISCYEQNRERKHGKKMEKMLNRIVRHIQKWQVESQNRESQK